MPDADDKSGRRDQNCHPRERALARLAARQLGVVSLEQLYGLGFTYEQVRGMVAHDRLHQLYRGAYAVGHRRVVDRAVLLAAQLSVGPRSFLSHRTAAAVWGLRPINTHEIELTLPGGGARRRAGLAVHRTRFEPSPHDIRSQGLLRVSSVMRLLVELAPREPEHELRRLVTLAVQKGLLRLYAGDGRAAVEEALERHARWPGLAKLTGVLAAYRRTDDRSSSLERAFDQLLRAHPEIPDPQRNVHIDRWEVDRCWPEQRLVVELDGRPYHIAVREMERDRIKDAALLRLGWTPIRITDARMEHDQDGILRDLLHFLGIRAAAA